jgi:hypothetical protein
MTEVLGPWIFFIKNEENCSRIEDVLGRPLCDIVDLML